MSSNTLPPASKSIRQNQSGLVAIMVTMVLMIVLSLIVLGFAQIARRNQRQALDRQLSTQAFYAAETGVNDAASVIKSIPAGTTIPPKTSCADTGGGVYTSLANPTGTLFNLDSAADVQYTCLLINPAPESLQYSTVNNRSLVIPLRSATGANISRVMFKWQSKQPGTTPTTGCPTSTTVLPPATAASWTCGYGLLRFDLVPTSGNHTVDTLSTNARTTFAVPQRTGGTNCMGPVAGCVAQTNLLGVACNNTDCTLSVRGLTTNQYYLRVSSLYRDSALQVSAFDAAGNPLNLTGAQALVDATGKAQDVLRRIQVRLPLAGSSRNALPDYAVQSEDALCKRFSIMQGYVQSDVTGVTSSGNPLCQP